MLTVKLHYCFICEDLDEHGEVNLEEYSSFSEKTIFEFTEKLRSLVTELQTLEKDSPRSSLELGLGETTYEPYCAVMGY